MRAPDFSLFRQRNFLAYWISRATYVLGWQIQTTALLWQAHEAALRAGLSEGEAVFSLGLIGLFQFIPLLALSLIGGQAADRYDRKTIILICNGGKFAIALLLVLANRMLPPDSLLMALFASAFLSGAINAFQPAATQALLPLLVDREDLPRAIPLNSLSFTTSTVLGPSLGGILLAFGGGGADGAQVAYGTAAILVLIGLLGVSTLRPRAMEPMAGGETRSLKLIKEGLGYVWNNKIVLGAISLDLVVVLLAGAQALIPAMATRLGVDHEGYGLLRAAMGIGAASTALALAITPLRRHVGRWMFGATIVFAAATILFGVSQSYWLSFAALIVMGASDMISVNVRQSMIQLATPDMMLGRVAAVNFIFVSASNELGDFEAGVMGRLLGPAAGIAFGGTVALCASVAWIKLFPSLWRTDTFEDETLTAARRASLVPKAAA